MTIQLLENNAGGLLIGHIGGPFVDVTPVQSDSSFVADAAALAAGDTKDWSVDWYNDDQNAELVATWVDGTITIEKHSGSGQVLAGRAAQTYLRIDNPDA